MSLLSRVRRIVRTWIISQFALALVASAPPAQMLSPHGIPTSPKISAEEQAGIDDDIAQHLGDVPKDPGSKANLSASLNPAAVHAAARKVADWELKRAEPYLNQSWTWTVLDT